MKVIREAILIRFYVYDLMEFLVDFGMPRPLVRAMLRLIPRLHDQAIIKQTSSKHRTIRVQVVHVYFECICWMFAL